ncbi:MAG: hypothetical protein ABH956_00905 [Candidatus Nealsonbacteria bacterium]
MITYSIIQKSKLKGALRIDAEYYQPEYLSNEQKIKNYKTIFIGDIADIVYGTTPTGGVFEKDGVPFIRSQNFLDNLIDDSKLVFCKKDFHIQNKKSNIIPGDILFAVVGATIGKLAIVQGKIKEGNINQNIARVRIKNEMFNPYFIGLFFASNFGQLQILRMITGNAQPYLNSDQIKFFIVPNIDIKKQNKIVEDFKKIENYLEKSKSLYSQAENLFLEKLELKDFGIKENLFSIVNLSDVKFANRIDAEYFQKKYNELISKIKNKKSKLLGDLVLFKKGIEVGNNEYQENGKPFIRVSNISKNEQNRGETKFLKEELYKKLKDDFEPREGEILLTKDATPGIAYFLKEPINGIISSGVLRLKLKEKINPEYLTLVLNSIIGQMQMERDTGGSIIIHWRPEQINRIVIPILSKNIQEKIADLVKKSHSARKKVKQLLEQAKQKVETLIENK